MIALPLLARLFPRRRPAATPPVTLRPIRPDDADALQGFVRALSPASRRMRVTVSRLRFSAATSST